MRWKLAAIAGWVLVGVVALAGAGAGADRDEKELRLRRLVIEDDDGRECIRLWVNKGRPAVAMFDPEGGTLGSNLGPHTLHFYSATRGEKPPLAMGVMEGTGPIFLMQDPTTGRAILSLPKPTR